MLDGLAQVAAQESAPLAALVAFAIAVNINLRPVIAYKPVEYCSSGGLSKPNCRRCDAIASGDGLGEKVIMAMGSPGADNIIRNEKDRDTEEGRYRLQQAAHKILDHRRNSVGMVIRHDSSVRLPNHQDTPFAPGPASCPGGHC